MIRTINNTDAYLGFNCFRKFGPLKIKALLNYFPNISEAFLASLNELIKAGITEKISQEFIYWRSSFQPDILWKSLIKHQISFITWEDAEYPALLLNIATPPPSLYYRGCLNSLSSKQSLNNYNLSIVGSRYCSPYATQVINYLLPPIIQTGIKIISGLALGVDTLAHQAALRQPGITWAILGSGLATNIYPPKNQKLAEQIISQSGALISEFPPHHPPLKQNFPQRNRLIAGLSAATLIIEAKERSGALITANYALEEGREVLTIPGNIFSKLSTGPNNLLKAGAKLITSPLDILEIFT